MKKIWNAPKLSTHGSVEAITEKTIAKQLGPGDDLATVVKDVTKYGDKGRLS